MALNTTKNIQGRISALFTHQGAKLTFDLLGIGGTSVMSIYLFRRSALVERDETVQQVITSGIVIITTRIIWEIITQRGARKFFGKKINLV